jgi:hypothetical protein
VGGGGNYITVLKWLICFLQQPEILCMSKAKNDQQDFKIPTYIHHRNLDERVSLIDRTNMQSAKANRYEQKGAVRN